MKSLANEFFKTMEDGARKHQAAHADAYELVATGIKDEQDVARQIEIVEQMIARACRRSSSRRPIRAPSSPSHSERRRPASPSSTSTTASMPPCWPSGKIAIPFVGPDNRKGARLVGEAVARRLTRGDPIAILEGAPNAFNGIQRKLGFEDAAQAAGLRIVRSQTAQWEAARANQVVSAHRQRAPRGEGHPVRERQHGARRRGRAQGRRARDGRAVGGFDNISAVQQLVRDGQIVATADQHGDQLAAYGIEYALQMLREPQRRPADRETPVDLITAETLR